MDCPYTKNFCLIGPSGKAKCPHYSNVLITFHPGNQLPAAHNLEKNSLTATAAHFNHMGQRKCQPRFAFDGQRGIEDAFTYFCSGRDANAKPWLKIDMKLTLKVIQVSTFRVPLSF